MRTQSDYRHAGGNLDADAAWPWARVFAHRCGGTLAPENTLPGLDIAARHGCGVEFDVMLSADGLPFLIHDTTLRRTTSGRGRVAATPAAVLRTLDAGVRVAPSFARTPIPELGPALEHCLALGLDANIEIKPAPGEELRTARVAIETLRAVWPAVHAPPLLSSFSEPALETARQLAPELPRGLLVKRVPRDWAARCARLEVRALHASAAHLRQATVRSVKTAGLWLVAYTENDPARAAMLFEMGVDCVITDRPDRVRPPSTDS